ncbi:Hypothetical predicted protein [Pelobates cultripes]|uniref:Reverse transcriptase domain-containing protein n=1 Tax=Pelobates cultripes TaxID=61616 RepID=A0AAD1SBC1_PELCU|nr:Hypothetical predicted protein [Pelobates cultripes]
MTSCPLLYWLDALLERHMKFQLIVYMSPLTLAVEPFLTAILNNNNIRGYQYSVGEVKVSAFADDVLFTIRDPLRTLPQVQTINADKCEILGISVPPNLQSHIQ